MLVYIIIVILFIFTYRCSNADSSINNKYESAIPEVNISDLTETITRPIFSKNRKQKEKEVVVEKQPIIETHIQEDPIPDFELSGTLISKLSRVAIIHDKKKQEYILKKENSEQDGWVIYKIVYNTIYLKKDTYNYTLKLLQK